MWIVPTYNRPERFRNFMESAIDAGCESKGIVVVNGGERVEDYRNCIIPTQWEYEELPQNIGMCAALNYVFRKYPNEPFYGLLTDDERIATKGWDVRMIDAAGSKYVAHANDGMQSETRIHSCMTLGGDLVRAIGNIAIPGLFHWYFDDMWELIAADFNLRKYVREVSCEHLHYLYGKAQKDPTYALAEARASSDKAIFEYWKNHQYPIIKKRIEMLLVNVREK